MIGKRILIIDDEESIRESLGDGLEMYGWKPSCAESAYTALQIAEVFDAYLVDLSISGQDGICLAKELKSRSNNAPVLLLSGYMNEKIKKEAKAAGIDAILKKPYKFEDVNQLLSSIIKERGK